MSDLWSDALRVARLVAADPHGCGGVLLRSGAGPVRERWLAALRAMLPDDAPFRRMPGGIADDRLIITFVTDDVDGCHARLSAASVPTDGPPRENPRYQIYHFFARDPAGYRVEVQRFLHPFP